MAVSQSQYFTDECRTKLNTISDWGFVLCDERALEKWACLYWECEDVKIGLNLSTYEYCMSVRIEYKKQQVNMDKLYDLLGIEEKYVYQYGRSVIDKCIESVTGGINSLLKRFDQSDHSELNETLEKCLCERVTPETFFLDKADQAYLSGKYKEAEWYYKQYDYALNNLQKKRKKRIERITNGQRAKELIRKYGFDFEKIPKERISELLEKEIEDYQQGSSEYIRLLCGYLYCLGGISDVELIKKSKYGINMDVGTMIDGEWIESLENGGLENGNIRSREMIMADFVRYYRDFNAVEDYDDF